MLQVLRPWVLHELQSFEKLGTVEILLRRDDVDHLVELVLFIPFDGTRDVSCEI